MILKSENISSLAAALASVQGKLRRLPPTRTADVRSRKGGGYAYRYADLADGWDLLRPLLAAAGLAVLQPTRMDADKIVVQTILAHTSGEWIAGELAIPVSEDMRGAQAIGSAITYARRYALWAMVGVTVADEDDDGAAATAPAPGAAPADVMLAEAILAELADCRTRDDCERWRIAVRDRVHTLPQDLVDRVVAAYRAHVATLIGGGTS